MLDFEAEERVHTASSSWLVLLCRCGHEDTRSRGRSRKASKSARALKETLVAGDFSSSFLSSSTTNS
jgi:hypothetical protein